MIFKSTPIMDEFYLRQATQIAESMYTYDLWQFLQFSMILA